MSRTHMLEDLGQRYVEERAFTVRDVMTPLIHQVPATASAAEAARLMIDQHVHRLIVTEGKEPVGIITSIDLLKCDVREAIALARTRGITVRLATGRILEDLRRVAGTCTSSTA